MPKNILWIMADEFRADCLRAAGNPVIETPHLDALAAEGALFTHCFVQASPCAPSRMCIYTGRYMCATGCLDNMTPLADANDNVAMHLRCHGFRPAIMGYNDYAIDPRTLPGGHPYTTSLNYHNALPGFEFLLDHEYYCPEWYAWLRAKNYPAASCCREVMYAPDVPPGGPGEHLPCWYPARYRAEDSESQFVTTQAVEYIGARPDTGWFLSLNYLKPHGPGLCPAPYHRMYDLAALPPATRRPEERDGLHPYLRRMRDNANDQLMDEREMREFKACYYGMVSEIDSCLGRLFQALRDSGQWENTLIIFSSDHGEHLGDHYLTGKSHYFDAALRVPLIIRDPSPRADATRGTRVGGFCEAIDIGPTICEWLGAPPHARFQGASLLPRVHDRPGAQAKPRIFFEYYYYTSLRDQERPANPDTCRLWVVRDDRFKFVAFGEEAVPPLLFDLRADPGEFVNVAQRSEYAAAVAEYAQHLIRWRIRNEDTRMERWARPYR